MNLEQAARQALGALVRAEAMYGQPNADIQTALREALANQAEQWPVAEVRVRPLQGYESTPKIDIEWLVRPTPGFLYAALVRTKDLTDDEIYECYTSDAHENTPRSFARAVIAADREKNRA